MVNNGTPQWILVNLSCLHSICFAIQYKVCKKNLKSMLFFKLLKILTKLGIEEVAQHAPQNGLVPHNHDIVLILQRRVHGAKTRHDVDVRLPPRVPVPQLVLVSPSEFLGEALLHLLVGEAFTDALVKELGDDFRYGIQALKYLST